MNKQRFKQIVNDYHNISEEDRSALHQLVKDHPYSQILHTLIAKANSDIKSNIAQQTLNYAAMYASDRSVLKNVIQKKPEKKTVLTEPTREVPGKKENQKTVSSAKEAEKDRASVRNDLTPSNTVPLKEGKPITVDTTQLSHASDDLIKEVWKDLADLKKSKSHYLSNSLSEESAPSKKTSVRKTSATKSKSATSKARSTSTSKTSGAQAKKTVKKAATSRTRTKAAAFKATKATSTTTSKTKTSKKSAAATKKTPKTTTKTTSAKKTTAAKAATSKKKVKTQEVANGESQKEIIERFIDEEPRISAKTIKTAIEDQKDLSEKSSTYSEDLISENLAQILLAQGKKEKAIEI